MSKYEPKVQKCDTIRDLLFDYMNRELGDSRSVLVREHLRKCDDCQAAARDIQATLDLLKEVSSADADMPQTLSDESRRRILLAQLHPVKEWVYRNHKAVSVAITIAALLLAGLALWKLKILAQQEPLDVGIRVTIGTDGTAPGPDPFAGHGPTTNETIFPVKIGRPPPAGGPQPEAGDP